MATTIYGTPTAAPIPGGQWGTGADKAVMSSGGVLTWEGTAKRKFTIRPRANMAVVGVKVKPVIILKGAWQYFRFPIYNTDEQELYYTTRCPYRWDGTTNPVFKILCGIESANDVGKEFQFQLSWNNTSVTGLLVDTTLDVLSGDIPVTTDHAVAFSAYSAAFTLDLDGALQQNLVARNNMSFRLRRVAVTDGTEITGNCFVTDAIIEFALDKVYGNW